MDAALVILDGWGLAPDDQAGRDAVAAADTPTFDALAEAGAYGTMTAHGRAVGLPEGQMGNSEVGHQNLGAGRVVRQAYTRIEDAIADGSFAENEAIASAFDHAADTGGRVHLMGLVSDGGVHADQAHLHALIRGAADRGVDAVTHAFTDGRDTDPHGGEAYLDELQAVVDEAGTGTVATVSGRYYAMDRDQNWERTRRAYEAIVDREAEFTAASAVEAVTESYERGESDEFVEPTLVEHGPGPGPADRDLALSDGDAVVFVNFRADRARQLVRLLGGVDPDDWPFVTDPPETRIVTMTEYDEAFPFAVAFPPNEPSGTLGQAVSEAGLSQLRLAESEKYAHVTYFLNGGREVEFDGEIRRIVPSPDVPTYDQQPEMAAPAVTDTAIAVVDEADPDLVVCNYANPDMVGHTGDFDAAVAAVEAVDEQLGRLLPALREAGGHVVVTADHGNADDMGTESEPHTAHTFNPVPVVYQTPEGDGGGRAIREGMSLPNVAPALLDLLGVERPEEMTAASLLD